MPRSSAVLVALLALALLPLATGCRTAPDRASLGGIGVTGAVAGPVAAAGEFLAHSRHLGAALGSPGRLDGLSATLQTATGACTVRTTAFGPRGAGPVVVELVESARGSWVVQGATLVLDGRTIDLVTGATVADPGP